MIGGAGTFIVGSEVAVSITVGVDDVEIVGRGVEDKRVVGWGVIDWGVPCLVGVQPAHNGSKTPININNLKLVVLDIRLLPEIIYSSLDRPLMPTCGAIEAGRSLCEG